MVKKGGLLADHSQGKSCSSPFLRVLGGEKNGGKGGKKKVKLRFWRQGLQCPPYKEGTGMVPEKTGKKGIRGRNIFFLMGGEGPNQR